MPLAESWQKLEEAFGGRSTLKGSTEEIRAQYDGLVQALMPMLPPFPENTTITEGEADGTKYRTYVPKDGEGPFPIAVWFHGTYIPSFRLGVSGCGVCVQAREVRAKHKVEQNTRLPLFCSWTAR